MGRFLARFKIGAQVSLIGAIGVIGLIAVGAIYLWGAARQTGAEHAMTRASEAHLEAKAVEVAMLQGRRNEKDFLLRRQERYLEQHAKVVDGVRATLGRLAQHVDDAEARAAIANVEAGVSAYGAQFAALGKAVKTLGLDENGGVLGHMRKSVQEVEKILDDTNSLALLNQMLQMRRTEKDFLARQDGRYAEAMKTLAARFADGLGKVDLPSSQQAAIREKMAAYQTDFTKVVEGTLDIAAATKKLSDIYAQLDPQLEKLESVITASYEAAKSARDESSAATRMMILFGIGFVVLAVAAMAWLIGRGIARPIATMTGSMGRLAAGDLDIAIVGRERSDEIGRMAEAMQVFKDSAVANRRMADEQAAEQSHKQARQQAIEQHIAAFEATVATALETLASAATEMRAAAESMSGTAEETSRQSTAVASASEQASSNVQTVAAATEELSSSIAEIGRQVESSTRIATKAVEEASRTNASVQGLAEAASKIGDVVQLINDIAAQTNLLALNATIEAARAGEAGKGFAVVASEVKSLANQTAKATEEIGAQISAIQGATGEAVTAIGGIGGTIRSINEIATTIASAVEEQGAATQEITRNVQQAAKGTQEVSSNIGGVNKAASETGAAASQVLGTAGALAKQSETLRTEVERFLANIRAA